MWETALDPLALSSWAYALLFAFAAGDALVPAVPSETAVVAAGVASAVGHLELSAVVGAAAAGAVVGDNTSYLIGRRLGRPAVDRFFRGARSRERLVRIERLLGSRGPEVIVVARFIPGGRTAATLSSGITRLPWSTRFAPFTVVAGTIWASYAALLGYLGGRLFVDHPFYGLLIALGIAAAIALAVEGVRRVRR